MGERGGGLVGRDRIEGREKKLTLGTAVPVPVAEAAVDVCVERVVAAGDPETETEGVD
jgi:hypothetical protein